MKQSVLIEDLVTKIVSKIVKTVCSEVVRSVMLLLILKTEVVGVLYQHGPEGLMSGA